MQDVERKLRLIDMYHLAHKYLSHKDRDIRDMALVLIACIREIVPSDMLED